MPPKLVRSDDVVADIREAREQQIRNQQALAAAEQGARLAKDASQASFEGDNVLSRVAIAGNA